MPKPTDRLDVHKPVLHIEPGFRDPFGVNEPQLEPSISGNIRWAKTLLNPLNPPHFTITANTFIHPAGSLGEYVVEATGSEDVLNSSDGTFYYLPYLVLGALLDKPLIVLVAPISASFGGQTDKPGSYLVEQISGPSSINLTNADPHVNNINFEMRFITGPR